MANTKKLIQAAAGLGGAGLNVEEVFSDYVYTGTGSSLTISNGIDLSGEGGLVWIKNRVSASNHAFYDTERGVRNYISSNLTSAQDTASSGSGLTAFNSNGFTLGTSWLDENTSGQDAVSWTFRKAPKFFTCLTYSGTGTAQTISHDLGATVGTLIVKRTDAADSWRVYHRSADATSPQNYYLNLDGTDAASAASTVWNNTAPTDTTFTVGTSPSVNGSGSTYVAYLFAHNDGDGEFGPDADADIIKCGDFTTDSSGNASVSLGFEPQWLLVKKTDGGAPWFLFDVMRGMPHGRKSTLHGLEARLEANATGAEVAGNNYIDPTSNGFEAIDLGGTKNHIYIAIRRGPMAVPTDAADVFAIDNGIGSTANPAFDSTFPVDFVIQKDQSGSASYVGSRLQGPYYLQADGTNAETDDTGWVYDHMDGYYSGNRETDDYSWMWKRAPNYFDVVAYTGTGVARTISHNLGVAPEMIWFKSRSNADNWVVYVPSLGNKKLYLNLTNAITNAGGGDFNDTAPTSTVFSVGDGTETNRSGGTHIAYLFASLDGVSKVFSVTKSSGSDASVNCGFSAGPRFVLLKRTDSTGDWYVWDSERGIVAGNDPYLLLNSTAAEVTSTDYIDPTSNGFTIVNGGLADGDYIGYAVA